MEDIFKRTRFSKPAYEQASRRLVETGGGVFSHPVGMAVHFVRYDRRYEFLVTHARFATIVLRRV
jgi:hypothetical protein